MFKKLLSLLLIISLTFSLFGCDTAIVENPDSSEIIEILEEGIYTSLQDVAQYIHMYDKLPSNYITKKDAMALGWESNKGNLWDVTDKGVIGGDRFGNREGRLPSEKGRIYYECDVNYEGGFRGAERLVYSNDGLIYYTSDHYETFEQLY